MTDTPLSVGTAVPPGDGRTELRTFLIADVRGYTRFTQERGDEAAARLVARFAAIMREGVRTRGGRVIELHRARSGLRLLELLPRKTKLPHSITQGPKVQILGPPIWECR